MNAGCYVGRIGGLAVALGVGAAVVAGGQGVAYADSTGSTSGGSASDTSGATAGGGAAGSETSKDTTKETSKESKESKDAKDTKDTKDTDDSDAGKGLGKKDRKNVWADLFKGPKPKPGTETDSSDTPTVPSDDAAEAPGDDDSVKTPPKKRWSWKPADAGASAGDDTESSTVTAPDDVAPTKTTKETKGLKGLLSAITVDAPEAATTPKTLINVSTAKTATVASNAVVTDTEEASTTTVSQGSLVTLFKKFLDAFTGNAPAAPNANSPFAWLAAAVSRRELESQAQQDDPTMVWNGLKVVPVGEPTITSFYGKYTMVPAFPGVLQGKQDFDLVDADGNTVGTIHGLVAINNDIGSGNRSLQIVVLDVTNKADGTNIGVKNGDIPPVGSIFAVVTNGRGGTQYSALAQDGKDVVTYKYITRFGSFRMNPDPFRINYSGADFLTDYEGINRPIHTQDGYYIKPVTDDTLNFTGFVGYEPLFNAIQGTQKFGVYKEGTDELMGTFDGVATVTSDFWGTTSEAIIVTSTDGASGVNAGDIPPVGTVYNIIYWKDEFSYALYYSKPQPGKDITKTLLISQTRKGQVVDELPLSFNASEEPTRSSYTVGDYTFKPTSDITYTGVNGLPPREVIVQGYQQFDVYDSKGVKIGSVDADVSTQWDISRGYSKAILVTDVNSSVNGVGTNKGEVPPVGSIFNMKYMGNSPFGEGYYSMPDPNGDKTRYELRTLFGTIPLPNIYNASKGLADYDFYTPYGKDSAQSNLLSFAGAQSGGLLGANQDLCVLDASACQVA